jgi:hypothetical protein
LLADQQLQRIPVVFNEFGVVGPQHPQRLIGPDETGMGQVGFLNRFEWFREVTHIENELTQFERFIHLVKTVQWGVDVQQVIFKFDQVSEDVTPVSMKEIN